MGVVLFNVQFYKAAFIPRKAQKPIHRISSTVFTSQEQLFIRVNSRKRGQKTENENFIEFLKTARLKKQQQKKAYLSQSKLYHLMIILCAPFATF